MGGMATESATCEVKSHEFRTSTEMAGHIGVHIRVEGVVQGVGFRPFVYRLATDLGLGGWVRNTSEDVQVEIEGSRARVREFIERLPEEAPALARIHHIDVREIPVRGTTRFRILESRFEEGKGQIVSPDVATCADCLAELFTTSDRRYRYPFTNCTNCGPRFTIITGMPYDRANTTMASFAMCAECQREYDDPANRRFHAQPNACPVCGPSLDLVDGSGLPVRCADPLSHTVSLLRNGHIIALKGLGGFLLACDATVPDVVRRLRDRKRRPSKPFAIMVRDIETARLHCDLTPEDESLLSSPSAPIVLARWRNESPICRDVAPHLAFLGIMLPYTPLHHILLHEMNEPLVMTSGNLSEEPIAAANEEALSRLAGIADYFLLHNRPIHSRYDDSVTMVVDGTPHMLRRARGYAPLPVGLPFDVAPILAVGPQMKNTFCLAHKRHAFVSQHLGDLDSIETLDHFEATIALYRRLFSIEPEAVAHDLHPDYSSTRFARQMASGSLRSIAVQHHHAHIVSCMVENGVTEPVIGVAFDGSGLGTDGNIWGGEFLITDLSTSQRAGHLEYVPLPGADAAILRPYRTAVSYVVTLLGTQALQRSSILRAALTDEEHHTILRQIETGLNTPMTSSMGRLFDAVAAVTGIRTVIDYDGHAAIELEMQAHMSPAMESSSQYRFEIERRDDTHVIRVAPVLDTVLRDISRGAPAPQIATAFHAAVSQMTADVCSLIATDTGISTIALSGGVFQNRILVESISTRLRAAGFRVLHHVMLPPNDACVSLGQAVAASQLT